ncbi:MAG: hypothetical protein ACD_67C00225G0004 [uncultured bacterium]|nr:MAG: hypothetical protein ACD_67C00225G0004 [uncultured bacterium]
MKMENGFMSPADIERKSGSKKLETLAVQEKISTLRREIKDLTKKDKDISTGVDGFRVKVKGETDPIEVEILKKEAEIRSLEKEAKSMTLEGEINKTKSGGESLKAIETVKKDVEDSKNKKDDDFVYAGVSEGIALNTEKGATRLTEVGTEGTENILDSENMPKNDGIERLTEIGTEGRHGEIEDSENIPKGEIVEDPNKFGSEGENIEGRLNGMNRAEMGSTASRIAQLSKEIELSRKEYLEMDYKKNTALSRIRKFFGNIGKYDDERSKEQDVELAEYRAHYDNKLVDLQRLKMADAKEHGASDEELANLFTEFRTEQKITLASEHDLVKIEQQDGNWLGKKAMELSNKYQALPTKTKLGIGAAFMAGGLAVGSAGAILGGIYAGAAVARRYFMGMTTGVGASLALEARGQMKDKERVERDRANFLEQIKNMSDEDKFKFLSSQVEGVAIKDSENTIDKVKNQDIRQKGAGVMVGTFLASGMAGELMKWGGGKVADFFGWGKHAEALVSAKPHEALKHIPVSNSEVLPIHGSVEKNLQEELIKHGIKDPGGEAHRMVLKFMEARGIDEPNLVYDNNNITIQPDGKGGFLLKDIGGEGKWGHSEAIEARMNARHGIGNVPSNAPSGAPTEIPTAVSPEIPNQVPAPGVSPEVLSDANHEFAKIETEMQAEGAVKELGAKIDAENMRVNQDISVADGFGKETFNADTFNDRNELVGLKGEAMALLSNLRAEDVPWQGMDSVEELISHDAGTHQILQSSLDKITSGQSMSKLAYWREIKDVPFEKVLFSGKGVVGNKEALGLMAEFDKIIGGEQAIPKGDETTKKWLARVTDLALKAKK